MIAAFRLWSLPLCMAKKAVVNDFTMPHKKAKGPQIPVPASGFRATDKCKAVQLFKLFSSFKTKTLTLKKQNSRVSLPQITLTPSSPPQLNLFGKFP